MADPATRGILRVLGEHDGGALTSADISERHPSLASQRLVRDRLRDLERGHIVQPEANEVPRSGTEIRWELTVAGQELYRLSRLISRIVRQAMKLPSTASPEARERVVQATLSAMSDPIVVQVGRVLAGAGGPLDPTELEERCAPTPRRTLYRRLSILVDAGVVRRETTREVPRRTRYEMLERWRPVAGALLLAAWWELRHDNADERGRSIDLSGLLTVTLPIVRVASQRSGRLLWRVEGTAGEVTELPLVLTDGRLSRASVDDAAPTEATLSGGPRAWASALVTEQPGELQIEGDEALALEVLSAFRAATLSYLR